MHTAIDKKQIRQIIFASSVGTLIEWYDFYLFGSLAPIIAMQFFPKADPTAALLSTLATFAAGFIVRPFGALVFGRLGDMVGRKYTFLLTLVLMGGSTFAIGLIPGYEKIGFAAPIIVLILRLIQGLALGGEYGGAATYVAEHSPDHKRGFYTSWIQTTATLGLLLSLGVILLTRKSLDANEAASIKAFESWGWRIPFWVSIVLVGMSIYIRMKMHESPLFSKLKSEGKISTNPIKESLFKRSNLKMVLLALFGATMGQGVVWYTGQFYAQTFLENACKIDFEQTRTILICAIIFATPLFIVFGNLSDKIGRKWIIISGMFLAIISYRPIYQKMLDLSSIQQVVMDDAQTKIESTIQVGEHKDFSLRTTTTQHVFQNGITEKIVHVDTLYNTGVEKAQMIDKSSKILSDNSYWAMVALIFVQILFVTMVYGPIAAFLVEIFPTKIRYTSMSLPYHLGNGVFGGLTPFIAVLLGTIYTADPLVGLWYPISVAGLSMVIGALYLSNKIDPNVND
ncbi:MAG: MHS family MFS transporter [Chitinophagaceae bacterium]|nr:MHS family MFS transporter [Chitinophagaceae bacterium]